MKLIVKALRAQPSEVCDKEDTACWAFCQPTNTDQPGPDAAMCSRNPVRSVGIARSCVRADFPVVWLVAAVGNVGSARLVVSFGVTEGFERKLYLLWTIGDSWYRTDRLYSATGGRQEVVFWFDVVTDERC